MKPEIHITGTEVNYYFVCHRTIWLFGRMAVGREGFPPYALYNRVMDGLTTCPTQSSFL